MAAKSQSMICGGRIKVTANAPSHSPRTQTLEVDPARARPRVGDASESDGIGNAGMRERSREGGQ
jgi:hypothetical protein